MNRTTSSRLKASGVLLLTLALGGAVLLGINCELRAAVCGAADAECGGGGWRCDGGEQDPSADDVVCFICWANCHAFWEPDPGALAVAWTATGTTIEHGELGPRQTYRPLLPPPRGESNDLITINSTSTNQYNETNHLADPPLRGRPGSGRVLRQPVECGVVSRD